MNYEEIFGSALAGLHREGRYRVFTDLERQAGRFPHATHHTPADLFAATHELDLVPRPELIVCLDSAHRGLGTASCGPDFLPRYRLGAGTFRFAYRLSLLRSTR